MADEIYKVIARNGSDTARECLYRVGDRVIYGSNMTSEKVVLAHEKRYI